MTNYIPDGWAIIKSANNDYFVFGSWTGGGMMGSDSWRRNSGIARYEEDEGNYYFYGRSGSCYECSKSYNHIAGYNLGVLDAMLKQNEGAELVEIDKFKEEFLNE